MSVEELKRWSSDPRGIYPKSGPLIVASCIVATLGCSTQLDGDIDERPGGEPRTHRIGDDTFMAGDELRLEQPTSGDAFMAGSSVAVLAPVHGDGVFAGGELELEGPFAEDVYAAGGQVRLTGDVAGNARLAGGSVTLGPESQVEGGVSIAAGRAEIAGEVGDYLQINAGSARLSGRVRGDLEVNGGELQLEPSAVVDGRLTFRGPQPARIAEGAVVRGPVQHVAADVPSAEERWLGFAMFSLIACLGLALVAAVMWAVWPGFTRSIEDAARQRSSRALLTGIAVVFGTPLVLGLLFVSLIGIPLGLLAFLAYLMLFPLGYLAATASLADWLLESLRVRPTAVWLKRAATLLLVLFGLSLIAIIPVAGGLVMMVLTLTGIGALVLASIGAHRGRTVLGSARPAAPGAWRPRPDEPLQPDKAPASA